MLLQSSFDVEEYAPNCFLSWLLSPRIFLKPGILSMCLMLVEDFSGITFSCCIMSTTLRWVALLQILVSLATIFKKLVMASQKGQGLFKLTGQGSALPLMGPIKEGRPDKSESHKRRPSSWVLRSVRKCLPRCGFVLSLVVLTVVKKSGRTFWKTTSALLS